MRRSGKKVASVPMLLRAKYSATKIRERVRTKKSWRDRVPRSVKKKMKALKAEERIRLL